VVGVNLGTEQPDHLAVDRHASFQNQLLARPARSHSGIGEKFLKTNAQVVKWPNREPLNR
jgi:hypothetical protein